MYVASRLPYRQHKDVWNIPTDGNELPCKTERADLKV